MNHRGPSELCRLLKAHIANLTSYADALDRCRDRAQRGFEQNEDEVADLKGRIVDEVNKVLSLMSPG